MEALLVGNHNDFSDTMIKNDTILKILTWILGGLAIAIITILTLVVLMNAAIYLTGVLS